MEQNLAEFKVIGISILSTNEDGQSIEDMGTTSTGDRGHKAEKPTQIPKKGWKDIALRVKDRLTKDHVSIVSAGIAFYFFLYVNNFGSFDEAYGSFAAVIILMLWLFLTGFIILLGAEINSEMEHQMSRDTTTGEDKPMGQRGGYHADHVAGKDKGNNERR